MAGEIDHALNVAFPVMWVAAVVVMAVTTPRVLRLRREIRYRVEAATRWQDKTPGWYRVPPECEGEDWPVVWEVLDSARETEHGHAPARLVT